MNSQNEGQPSSFYNNEKNLLESSPVDMKDMESPKTHYSNGKNVILSLKKKESEEVEENNFQTLVKRSISKNFAENEIQQRTLTAIDLAPNKSLVDRNCIGCNIF